MQNMLRKLKIIERDQGLTLIELLVSILVGALLLSVLVVVSSNLYNIYGTTKNTSLSNNDNYGLTALLHDIAQDANSVSAASTGVSTKTITLAMFQVPSVVPTSVLPVPGSSGTSDLTLSWNGNQLFASHGTSSTVIYTVQNNASQNTGNYSFSLPSSPNYSSTSFYLLPPTSNSILFHVNNYASMNSTLPTDVTKNFSGLTLNLSSTLLVPGRIYTISGQITGSSGSSSGNNQVSISVSPSSDGNVTTIQYGPNGTFTANYSVPNGATIGQVTFKATNAGATASTNALIGNYTISPLTAAPSSLYQGGSTTITGTVLFNKEPVNQSVYVDLSSVGGGTLTPSGQVTTGSDGGFTFTYKADNLYTSSISNVTVTASLSSVYGNVQPSDVLIPILYKEVTITPVSPNNLPKLNYPYLVSGQTQLYIVNVQSSDGQPISGESITLSDGGAGGSFTGYPSGSGSLQNNTVITDSQGNAEFYYQTVAGEKGTVTITATDTSTNIPVNTKVDVGNFEFTNLSLNGVAVSNGNTITVMTNQSNVPIKGQLVFDGGMQTPFNGQTVQFSDQYSGQNVGGVFSTNTGTTDSNGDFSVQYTPPNVQSVSGQIEIQVPSLLLNTTIPIKVLMPSITVNASPDVVSTSGTVTITGVVSLGGNADPNQTVVFSDNGAGGTFGSQSVTTGSDGSFTVNYTAPNVANNTDSITVTDTTLNLSFNTKVDVEVPTMTLIATPSFTASSPSLVSTDGTVTINGTLTLKGTPLSNQTISFTDNGAGGIFASSTVTTDSNGNFTVNYTAPNVITSTDIITATASGLGVSKSATLDVESPTITLKVQDQTTNQPVSTITSGGTVDVTGTIYFDGKPYSNQTVVLSDNSGGGTFGNSVVTTDQNGIFTTTYTAILPSLPYVIWSGDAKKPVILIYDNGFGSTPPTNIPDYNTDGNYVGVHDLTGDWNMGTSGNYVAEDILQWSNNFIEIRPSSQPSPYGDGLSGYFGWYTHNDWYFNQGDNVTIDVQTASGQTVSINTTVNYQSDQYSAPVTITATSDGAVANQNLTVNLGNGLPVPQNSPTISNVEWSFNDYCLPTITINGSGFGTLQERNKNWFGWLHDIWNSNRDSIVIKDNSHSWGMGNWDNRVQENILSWSNTQINVLSGWGYGNWGSLGYNVFQPGDSYTITLTVNGISTSYSGTVPTYNSGSCNYVSDHGDSGDGDDD